MPQVVKNIGLVDWVVVTVTLWSLNIANWKITIRKWVLHQTKWAMASKTLKLPEVGIEVFVQTTCCWEEKIPETTHQCVCIEYIYILYIHIYICTNFQNNPIHILYIHIYIYMYQLSEQSQQIRLTWTAAAPLLVAWHADKVPLVSRRRCPDYLSWKCRKLIAKLRLTQGDIADEIHSLPPWFYFYEWDIKLQKKQRLLWNNHHPRWLSHTGSKVKIPVIADQLIPVKMNWLAS